MRPVTQTIPDLSVLHPVRVIATGFNLLARQQPWAAARLARHAGKTLRVSLASFQVTLTIDSEGRLSQADSAIVPDVVLDIIPEKLTVSRLFDDTPGASMADMIHVTGEAALAQGVSELSRDLRPDPEDALAQWVGDVPARRVMGGMQSLFEAAQALTRGLTGNVSEYLAEEADLLVGRPAMTTFEQTGVETLARIEALFQRQATLAARLDRLDRLTRHKT